MVSEELIAIKKIFAKQEDVQELFDKIIQKALEFKYKGLRNSSLIIPVSGKDITESIFDLNARDEIEIYGQKLNGQRITELFIATIYLKLIVSQTKKGSYVMVAFPFQEKSFDIAFYVINGKTRNKSGKLYIPEDSEEYKIQIKENFDFKQERSGKLLEPELFDIGKVEKMAEAYHDELVLVFSRNFSIFESEPVRLYLEKNKNVGIILIPSPVNNEIKITDGRDKGKKILLKENQYNFFLVSDKVTIHLKFNRPKFFKASR